MYACMQAHAHIQLLTLYQTLIRVYQLHARASLSGKDHVLDYENRQVPSRLSPAQSHFSDPEYSMRAA